MAITYGTSGIKKKSYRVYIAEADTSGLDAVLDNIIGSPDTISIDIAIAEMFEFGECRDDSITVVGEDGETIQGNVVGNLVINKACSFSAELINSTPDNIDAIEALDGIAVSVLLVEKDSHMDGATEKKLAIIIKNKNLSYTENITGGDTGRGTISLSSSPRKIDDFRTIVDCEVVA